MKRNSLTLIALLIAAIAGAQITIVSSDMPSTGQSFRTSMTTDFLTYNFDETGNNFVWNFQDLTPLMQREAIYTSVSQTPIIFWPFFLGSANLATQIEEFSLIPEIPIESGYQFFNKTTTKYSDIGIGLSVSGLPLPLKYNNPDVLFEFPMNLNYSKTSNSDLGLAIPNVGYLAIDRQRVSVVDGWGTLNTPFGSFQVLRLKSTITEYDSLYLDTLGQGFAINREYIEYKWLGKGKGLPLLTVTQDFVFGSTIVYLDSLRILPPSNLSATPTGSSEITVEWDLNFSGDAVMLAWSPNGVFGTPGGNLTPGSNIPGGGTVLYTGLETVYNHTGLNPNTEYHYKLWSRSGNAYSSAGIITQATTLPSAGSPGDANCDGFVNVLDIVTINSYVLGQSPSPFCFDNADVNNDGMINVLDVVMTVNIILGN